MGGEYPVLFEIALFFHDIWYLGYILAIGEILLWIFLRNRLYLVYINALLLIGSSSLSTFCFLTVFGPFFRMSC